MDPLLEIGFTTAVIEGTEWKMRHKCTAITSAAAGASKVLGVVNGANANAKAGENDVAKAEAFMEVVLRQAMVCPRVANDEEESVPGEVYQYDELRHVQDALLAHYLQSGLSVEVFPKPCEAEKGATSQGR